MKRFRLNLIFLPLVLAAMLVFYLASAVATISSPVKVVPYKEECERLLSREKMSKKKMSTHGYELLTSVSKLPFEKVENLYMHLLKVDATDPSMFDKNASVVNRTFESSFYLDNLLNEEFVEGAPAILNSTQRSRAAFIEITSEQASFLRNYLLDIKKEAERSLGREVEYEQIEIRVLDSKNSKLNDENILYHYDFAAMRLTVSLMGPSTFVRDAENPEEEIYTAPSNVPLLFAADKFNDYVDRPVPITFHGHPRTHDKRMIIVATLKFKTK